MSVWECRQWPSVGLSLQAFLRVPAVFITLSFCFLVDPRPGKSPRQHGWLFFLILDFIESIKLIKLYTRGSQARGCVVSRFSFNTPPPTYFLFFYVFLYGWQGGSVYFSPEGWKP